MKISIPLTGQLVLVFLFAWQLAGCDQCKVDADCDDGLVCSKGKCIIDDEDTDSDSDSSAGETDDPVEGATESETGEATGETDDPGVDGGDTRLLRENGATCARDEQCASDHCQNDLCCPEGDCCSTPGDNAECPTTTCQTSFCDGNFHCEYHLLSCGAVDLEAAEPCRDSDRCDGEGSCLPVTPCDDAAYSGSGEYVCTEDTVAEVCLAACARDADCESGFYCVESVCIALLSNGEAGCDDNLDCASGHCDTGSGICCEAGTCCTADDDCGRYACDTTAWSCLTHCRDADEADDDGRCTSAGDYHCDNGWCYEDLTNGEQWCDESSDCLSDHCDDANAMCCADGRCCDGDAACGGARCLVDEGYFCVETCTVGGVDMDNLCAVGYACQDGTCVSGALQNGAACTADGLCASGHCDNGYCCAEGECCATVADCTAESLCNRAACSGAKQCVYYPLACASYDLGDGEICTGENRCDGHGGCVPISGCEGGYIGESFGCSDGAVFYNCLEACADDLDCEEGYHCEEDMCVEDLLSGEGTCDSNLDCASGNCNEATGVCCESGYCCNDDGQCEAFALTCDDVTDSCLATCTLDNDCAVLGDYHCKDGLCQPDLLNGDQYCLEDTECLSEYCEVDSGVCCGGGDCCLHDGECGGFACDDLHSCITDCNGNSGRCAPGYYCTGTVCEPATPNGETCLADDDCASGHCDPATNICCDGGDCCLDVTDCDPGNECTDVFCSAGYQCYSTSRNDGESCSDGQFCNGVERCDGGLCVPGPDPCPATTVCLFSECDEGADQCNGTPRNAGETCSDPLFCLGGVAMVCNDTGRCMDPGTGTPPCTAPTGDPCTQPVCDEDTGCGEGPVPNGLPCDDDPCTGNNLCQDGVCQPADDRPCDDGDPCTLDACTDDGGTPVCGGSTPIADGEPCEPTACMGAAATCRSGVCVPAEERPCVDGDICTVDSCALLVSGVDCESRANAPTPVACGATVPLVGTNFVTAEYYDYGGPCPEDLPGPESIISVETAAGDVTVSVGSVDPAVDIEILYLGDVCDAASCTASGANSLTVALAAGAHDFVLEAPAAAGLESLEVTVLCP